MDTDLAAGLRAVPDGFAVLLATATDAQVRHRPADGEWSAVEVAGHLIDKANNWRTRVLAIRDSDAPEFELYHQDECVAEAGYQSWDVLELVQVLREAWNEFASAVEGIKPADLDRTGHHPAMGEMTMRDCIVVPLKSADDHLQQAKDAIAG